PRAGAPGRGDRAGHDVLRRRAGHRHRPGAPGVSDLLEAPHRLEFPYRRSVGPVLGRFLAGLRDCRIEGVVARDGRVLVPPQEQAPVAGEPRAEWVTAGPGGAVVSWAWIAEPLPRQPLDRPFAWALVQLDGADTALVHAVDAGSEAAMRTGM